MKYWSAIILLVISHSTFAQNKQKELRLNCIPHWKKGEEKVYLISRKKEKIPSVKAEDFLIETKMTVLDSSATGYTIKWVYGIPEEVENNPLMKQVAAFFEGMKFVYKTDDLGSFSELENWEEVRDFYINMLKMQFAGRNDSTIKKIMDQTLAHFQTREMVESMMIKEIQLFHVPYGVSFSTKDTSVNTEITIPLTNSAMPAIQRWLIREADASQNNFNLVLTQEIDSVRALEVIESIIKKFSSTAEKNVEELRKELTSIKMEDRSEYSYIRSTGWLKSYYVTRTVKAGNTVQVETYKIELRQ